MPVASSANEDHIGEVGGNLIMISAEITRPGDTTGYTAGDVVSDSASATTIRALSNAARVSGGSGFVVGVRIVTDKKSITPRFRVHLFNTIGATVAADNAAWRDLYADNSKRIGYIDLDAMTTGADAQNSDMSRAQAFGIRVPYTCVATSLHFVLETLDAFTPAASQKITLIVFCDRN